MLDAFTGKTDNGFRLGTGADSDFEIATEGRDDSFTSKNSQSKGNFVVDDDIITFSFENRAVSNFKTDIESVVTNAIAFIDTGRNLDSVLFALMDNGFFGAIGRFHKFDF